MSANDRQVGGKHYGGGSQQHWDIVAAFKLDYFQGQITKYVMRWRDKGGVQDLEKARHFLDKYIELAQEEKKVDPTYHQQRNLKIAGEGLKVPQEAPMDWTIEGFLVRDGQPVQVYKHKICGVEVVAPTVSEAAKQHLCPTHAHGNSEGAKAVPERAERADSGSIPTSRYTNQG